MYLKQWMVVLAVIVSLGMSTWLVQAEVGIGIGGKVEAEPAAEEVVEVEAAEAAAEADEAVEEAAEAVSSPEAAVEAEEPEKEVEGLTTLQDRVSYAIGLQIGESFQDSEFKVNEAAILSGLRDGLKGEQQLSDEKLQATFVQFQAEMQKQMAEKAKKENEKFIAEFKAQEGVKTTESGLMYKADKQGEGDSPKATDTVTVHYTGKLMDGTVFDSSVDRGQPATFPLNRVIAGWTEGLQLMKPGAKYQFLIPADLAYGAEGGGPIPPNAMLHFQVELISVKKAE